MHHKNMEWNQFRIDNCITARAMLVDIYLQNRNTNKSSVDPNAF